MSKKFDYKVTYSPNAGAMMSEPELDALGAEGFECFHVVGRVFYFKREIESPEAVYHISPSPAPAMPDIIAGSHRTMIAATAKFVKADDIKTAKEKSTATTKNAKKK